MTTNVKTPGNLDLPQQEGRLEEPERPMCQYGGLVRGSILRPVDVMGAA